MWKQGSGTTHVRWTEAYGKQFVMWMQQGRICILGKIEFSIDNENAGKNAQVKLYFMPELKSNSIVMKEIRHLKTKKNKRNLNIKWFLLQNDQNADTTLLHSHDELG